MKLRFIFGPLAVLVLLLSIFSSVGEQFKASTFTIGDASGVSLCALIVIGTGFFFGYVLGIDDEREKHRS